MTYLKLTLLRARPNPPECAERGITLHKETINCNVKALPSPDTYFWHVQPYGFEVQHLTTGSPILPLGQITGPLAGTLAASCEASNGIASQEEQCEKIFSFENLRPQQPQQCDLAFEYGEFQIRCIPVENATYYEVSVWKMSTTNTSLILDRRASMGFGSGQALAQGAWLPFRIVVFLEKDVGISVGALVLVGACALCTLLAVRLARRPRSKGAPVIQVLQLDDVARSYLDNVGEHKIHASGSQRSYSSGYSEASHETAPTIDRRRKPTIWDRWEQPPPDVTLTLHRESAV
ncbi:Uncharacterized protein OBRU01_14887 [Operophtera brumata]|uniref:Uncharacterized protein n=1 Tax=Operophtera brumata TaxID=104452 RepID=A0A0L7L6L7_OPEBR|nr:Uncharacterized protein OBRU01_14887 [Operophtera brumata]